MDNPQKEITTAHVFHTKKQRQYPQTRRVIYTPLRGSQNKYEMSPVYIDENNDLEGYNRRRLRSAGKSFSGYPSNSSTSVGNYSNQIVQEVAVSYSAPLTISPPPLSPSPIVQISSGDKLDSYESTKNSGSLQDYISDYDQRIISGERSYLESVERVNSKGRHETEFPVRIAYIGGAMVAPVHSVPIVSVEMPSYRGPNTDSRASTQRITNSLGESILSETTTIEELTTVTTTNSGRNISSVMPGVNELTQKFEQTARKEYSEAQRNRRSPPCNMKKSPQKSPREGTTRVVVVSKPGPEFVYSTNEARVRRIERPSYSPSDLKTVISTTIVDIEPPNYRSSTQRYIEETYQIQEEYRSIKTYSNTPKEKAYKRKEVLSPTEGKKEIIKESVSEHIHVSRCDGLSEIQMKEVDEVRGSTPVRSVVEQFESKIEAEGRKTPEKKIYSNKESIDEITVHKREPIDKDKKEKEVYIPKTDLLPTRKDYTETSFDVKKSVVSKETPSSCEPMQVKPLEVYIPRKISTPPVHWKNNECNNEKKDIIDVRTEKDSQGLDVNAYEEIVTTVHKEKKPKITKQPSKVEEEKDMDKTTCSVESFNEYTSSSSIHKNVDNYNGYSIGNIGISSGSNRQSNEAQTYSCGLRKMETEYKSGISPRIFSLPSRYSESACYTPYSGSTQSNISVEGIKEAREKEKKDMCQLNDRFARYIEQVRFHEAHNRILEHDLNILKSGKHAQSVRHMYETEIKDSIAITDDSNKQSEMLCVERRSLQNELSTYQKKHHDAENLRGTIREDGYDLLRQLAKLEAEVGLTKRRNAMIEEECKRLRVENNKLSLELSNQNTLLEQERMTRIDYENQAKILLEECHTIKVTNSASLEQFTMYRDTTAENREFFRRELAEAIREIRQQYDIVTSKSREEMEMWYKKTVTEIRTSSRSPADVSNITEKIKVLRTQLTEMRTKLGNFEGINLILGKQIEDLNCQIEDEDRVSKATLSEKDDEIRFIRSQCEKLSVELSNLIETKVNLEAEIAIYRKMLEGEENRAGLRQLVENVVRASNSNVLHGYDSEHVRRRTAENSRSLFQRSATGNVAITEVSPEGRFVVLENTSLSHEENIGEWSIKSRSSSHHEVIYTLPSGFVLYPQKKVTIYARGHGHSFPPESLVFEAEESFATGSDVHTHLYNKSGEERATLLHRSSAY